MIMPAFDPSELRARRLAAGMTQAELADRASVSPITICVYERGRINRPRKSVLERILKALADGRGPELRQERPGSDGGLLVGSFRITCPHCGDSSYTFSEIPGVEYKCISCSRVFRVDAKGRGYIPPAPPPTKAHDAWHGKRLVLKKVSCRDVG